jgi:hypothetical protein
MVGVLSVARYFVFISAKQSARREMNGAAWFLPAHRGPDVWAGRVDVAGGRLERGKEGRMTISKHYPNNPTEVTVLEANDDEQDKYGHRYGSDTVILSMNHIMALIAGKMLSWNDGEYSTFVILDTPD